MRRRTSMGNSLTFDSFWSIKTASGLALSPDGKTAAYVVGTYDEAKNGYGTAIWLADIESGESRQFTTGEAMDSQPAWSPDGRRLAFVSTRSGGKPQVFVIDLHGGEPKRLTNAE